MHISMGTGEQLQAHSWPFGRIGSVMLPTTEGDLRLNLQPMSQ